MQNVVEYKFDAGASKAKRFKRNNSPLFFAWIVDFKWYLKHGKYLTSKDVSKLELFKKQTMEEMNVDSEFLTTEMMMKMIELRNVEIMPVCAIMGGFLTQEVLKGLTRAEVPFNNFFCHDGMEQTSLLMTI